MFIGPCYMKTFPRAVRYLEFAFFYKEWNREKSVLGSAIFKWHTDIYG